MPLRVGTDCSGIEAPIQALRKMGIPFVHVFSSEIDLDCRLSLLANYSPQICYHDMTKRNLNQVPTVDLYVCGFSCQPFSTAGQRSGLLDDRSNVFWSALDYIRVKKPKYFLLENVPGLLSHDSGKTWQLIKNELKKLEDYTIYFKVLNTKDYGLPQNRRRLYIIGTKKTFEFPLPSKKRIPLKSIINSCNQTYAITSERHEKILNRIPPNSYFIEFAFGVSTTRSFVNADEIAPCITANTRLWCVPYHRYADCIELLRLQGFDQNFVQVVSNSKLKKQIGNSMSVPVIVEILRKMIL